MAPSTVDSAEEPAASSIHRNIQDAGGAEIVLGPVTKSASGLITERMPWEMRFDNMQPNVWYDNFSTPRKWRAWWSTFATCGFNNQTHYPGPGRNASIPLQCQALPSHCNLSAHRSSGAEHSVDYSALPKATSRNGLFLYAESTEEAPTKEFHRPSLGKSSS